MIGFKSHPTASPSGETAESGFSILLNRITVQRGFCNSLTVQI